MSGIDGDFRGDEGGVVSGEDGGGDDGGSDECACLRGRGVVSAIRDASGSGG